MMTKERCIPFRWIPELQGDAGRYVSTEMGGDMRSFETIPDRQEVGDARHRRVLPPGGQGACAEDAHYTHVRPQHAGWRLLSLFFSFLERECVCDSDTQDRGVRHLGRAQVRCRTPRARVRVCVCLFLRPPPFSAPPPPLPHPQSPLPVCMHVSTGTTRGVNRS